MDAGISALIALLAGQFGFMPAVFGWLGTLVVIGSGIAPLTPTEKDDNFWAKVFAIPLLGPFLKALEAFSPLHKKNT